MSDSHVIRIKPFNFIHVLDNNTNVTALVCGPKTFTRKEHQEVIYGPKPMIMVPPRHYCVIANPVIREDGKVQFDEFDNVLLKHGDEEIRFSQDPFPLYPGEQLLGKILPLTVVAKNSALRLRCIRDFVDEDTNETHVAGDEWLFPGPQTYKPRVEVQVVEKIKSIIIKQNEALKLKARKRLVDSEGNTREASEEWLVRTTGAYLPNVDEEFVKIVQAQVITEKKALQLRAKHTFKCNVFDVVRKAGEEWLVTFEHAETHIPDVHEEVVGEVYITTLTNRQYCYVVNPYDEETGKLKYGQKELRKGECSFFLKPGEYLEKGIQNIEVLDEEEALLLCANQEYDDGEEVHSAGDKWMIHGPCDYVPPIEVEIVEKRRFIPLDENEGIYVRNLKTGEVRAVIGQSYLLKAHEVLFPKEVSPDVEELLDAKRKKTQVISYRAPHNSAVQIYDYKAKESRVVFGPELVMLNPDEMFTVLNLSSGKPKSQNGIKTLSLLLGPDFMTDIVEVETSDHARLRLQLAYNWHFDVQFVEENDIDPGVFFSVPDFVGDACKAIASRVRGAVASATFENFHRTSADIIKAAVFGKEDNGELRNRLKFQANHLVITNIDIQSVEPIDESTRESLQKSVQLAIEITTKSQEASARQEAQRKDQKAKGELQRQKIEDEAEAERSRKELLELQAHSSTIEITGAATAEAKAKAQAAYIEGEAAVKQAELKAEAIKIKFESEMAYLKSTNTAQLSHRKKLDELEINKAKEEAAIEVKKFKEIVEAITPEVIADIARAGPEMQAKLLGGLGLQGMLITDGNSPINLFNTAGGLLGGPNNNENMD